MGPKSTYLGPEIPKEDFVWQDPISAENSSTITTADLNNLKSKIEASGLSTGELVST